ncbi:MAG TPA: Nramp family divalent metal transporter [Pseudonocardiaceae bacterium]|nr:Nramp family divalent metal transporter [Pseudonocardiaceae bacterium]
MTAEAVRTAPRVLLSEVMRRGRVRGAVGLFGPALIASVAYVDPGNFATNFLGGAAHGYRLGWAIVLANLVAIVVQYLTSKAGLATGRSLPELCRARYGRRTNALLWIQAELVAMATDLAEFVGAAAGLNLVFGVPPLPAGLITGALAFLILALEQRGFRKFELAIVALLVLIAGGFGYLFFAVGHQDYGQLTAGLVPGTDGGDSLELVVAIVGATVMPHVVYLHSALQSNRIHAADARGRRTLSRYNTWDCVLGLGAAGLVNLAMLWVAAALLHRPGHGTGDFAGVHAQLASLVGGGAALAFGVALMASGLSSSSVGTCAGQVVMAGFVNVRIPLVLRRALTMVPSLVVLGFAVDTSQALLYSQVGLSLGIPFALVPLLVLTRDGKVMGDLVNRRGTTALLAVLTVLITGLNTYLVGDAVVGLFQ